MISKVDPIGRALNDITIFLIINIYFKWLNSYNISLYIGLISLNYSPTIIRALKEFKSKDQLKNKELTLLIQFTEKIMLKQNKR